METDFGVKQPAEHRPAQSPGPEEKKTAQSKKNQAASGQNSLLPMRKRFIGCAQPYRQKQVGSTAFLF
jgi:hypothetical protein